jgi:hypothetical protein
MCAPGAFCQISFTSFLILCVPFIIRGVLPKKTNETHLKSMSLATSDPEDELAGRVRTVIIEKAELQMTNGKLAEGQRRLLRKITYDSEMRELEELNYDSHGVLIKRSLRIYDLTGKLQEIRTYTPDGSLICRQVYSQDLGNRIIEELAYRGRETLEVTKTVYSLDESGKVVTQTTLDALGQLSTRLVMEYNMRGTLYAISMCVCDSDQLAVVPGGAGTSVLLSDEMRHRLKGLGPCSDALLTSRTVFSRDRGGHLIEVAIYTGEGVLVDRIAYSREYDSHGNWIRETQSKWEPQADKFEPLVVTYRKIIYR